MKALRRLTVRAALPERAEPLGAAGHQPALVLAPASHGPVRRPRPRAVGRGATATRSSCSARSRAERLDTLAKDREFLRRLHDVADDLRDYLTQPALVPALQEPIRSLPASIAYFSAGVRHHRGAAAVLRRPRHPGRRPPQGRLATSACRSSASACCTGPATSRQSLSARRLAAGALPVARPAGPAADAAARRRRQPGRVIAVPLPEGRDAARRRSGWPQVGRVPLLLLDTDIEENDAGRARGHRPALRRRPGPPAQAGDAARHRRRPGGARVLRAHRPPGSRRCSTPTRATPASSASSGSAS